MSTRPGPAGFTIASTDSHAMSPIVNSIWGAPTGRRYLSVENPRDDEARIGSIVAGCMFFTCLMSTILDRVVQEEISPGPRRPPSDAAPGRRPSQGGGQQLQDPQQLRFAEAQMGVQLGALPLDRDARDQRGEAGQDHERVGSK